MLSGSNFSQSKLNLSLLIWVCFVLFAFNVLVFTFFATASHIRSDVLRHLDEIVLPLLEGRVSLAILWSNQHPSPLLHLIQIANLKFFGFRLDYDAYLGVLFQILGTFLILRTILSNITNEHSKINFLDALGGLLIIAISLGFSCLMQYTWPLLATVQYLYFFAITVFLLVDRCIAAESRYRLIAVAATSLLLMFANADFGTIFLASIIAVLMIVYCIERRAVYLRTILIMAAVWIAYRLLMQAILPEGPPRTTGNTTQLIASMFIQPIHTFTQFAVALSMGLADTASLKKDFPGTEHFLVEIAQVNGVLFIAIFFIYLRKRLYRTSVAPLALMLSSVIFSASIFVYRYYSMSDTVWDLASKRYAPSFKLAIIGMLWALWLIIKNHVAAREKPIELPYLTVAAFGIVLMIFFQGAQILSGWTKMPKIRDWNDNQALVVFLAGTPTENAIALPLSITETYVYTEFSNVLAYLKENRLNVFSDDFPAGKLLDQHVKTRRLFNSSDNALTVVIERGEHEKVFKKAGNISIDWKILPTGIFINNTTEKTFYLRIKASSNSTIAKGISLSFQSKNGNTQHIPIFKGHQNRFFRLEKGERLEVETAQPVRIEEFELRS